MNKVILCGRLGADPEMITLSSGKMKCNMSLATQDGKYTDWHRLVAWERTAELCGEYLTKGREVLVEGRLKHRKVETENGTRTYSEVHVWKIQFLGGRGDTEQSAPREKEKAPANYEKEVQAIADSEVPF